MIAGCLGDIATASRSFLISVVRTAVEIDKESISSWPTARLDHHNQHLLESSGPVSQ